MNEQSAIESFRFWDVVRRWGRERLEHDTLIAQRLARGVIVDGLRLESADPRWLCASKSLGGYPYVGYSAKGDTPVILTVSALEHLLAIVQRHAEPSREILADVIVQRHDFSSWLSKKGEALPAFWSESPRPAYPQPA